MGLSSEESVSTAQATGSDQPTAPPSGEAGAEYIAWLESRSMLYQAHHLSDHVSGRHLQWRHSYAHPKPQEFVRTASVWFTSYPKSIITAPDKSVRP